MFTITHRIQLLPNNKQKTYFCKAIGCSRLAYNWGLDEWKRRYETGERLINGRDIRNSFNAIRKEQFPFTYEVTKYATASAFDDLQVAFNKFFAHQAKFPKKHKKKDGKGSFNIGNDHPETLLTDTNNNLKFLRNVTYNIRGKHQYLNVPNLGRVKMSQRLRFNGKIIGVRISQDGEKFFASFFVI